jgi:hypothetical protein
MMTAGEAVAALLEGKICAACGSPAPGGEPCPECGALPEVTGPELAAELAAAPLAVAEIEARQAIAEGHAQLDAAIDRLHDADRIRAVARLRLERDQAQEKLLAHQSGRPALAARVRSARKPAAVAEEDLKRAQAEHADLARDLEIARRYKTGVTAQADAAIRLDKATAELAGYRTARDQAAAGLASAEAALQAYQSDLGRLEQKRDTAAARLASPGRIGYGIEAMAAGLLRLLLRGELDDGEVLLAGTLASWLCSVTGAAEGIQAQAKAELRAEQENEHRAKPLMRGFGQDGQPAAIANPFHTGTPQAYHPQTGPAHPVQPSVTPGWPL